MNPILQLLPLFFIAFYFLIFWGDEASMYSAVVASGSVRLSLNINDDYVVCKSIGHAVNHRIYTWVDAISQPMIVWSLLSFVVTLLRAIHKWRSSIEQFRESTLITEGSGLMLTCSQMVCFCWSVVSGDWLTALLFAWWGPGFWITVYWYLKAEKERRSINWSQKCPLRFCGALIDLPLKVVIASGCKVAYVAYMLVFGCLGLLPQMYAYSLWIMNDNLAKAWLEKDADRTRRCFDDCWMFRMLYPGLLLLPWIGAEDLEQYKFVSLFMLIGWLGGLLRLAHNGQIMMLPRQFSLLRNIVYFENQPNAPIAATHGHAGLQWLRMTPAQPATLLIAFTVLCIAIMRYKANESGHIVPLVASTMMVALWLLLVSPHRARPSPPLKVVTVDVNDATERRLAGNKMRELEGEISYPLGPGVFFKIDHGQDYFAFFQRLGSITYAMVLSDPATAAGGVCAIERVVSGDRIVYIADLKIRKAMQGQGLSSVLIKTLFRALNATQDTAGYAINMDPDGGENWLAKKLTRLGASFIGVSHGPSLLLYSLDFATMHKFSEALREVRGRLSYLSTGGVKDLQVVEGGPLKLLHVQFGTCAAIKGETHLQLFDSPQDDFDHMFCTPETDTELIAKCNEYNLKPMATATILHANMSHFDWRFILTSDI